MNKELLNIILSISLIIISIIASYLVSYLAKLKHRAQAEIENIEDQRLRELANNALNRISELAVAIVDSFQQELVNTIKKGIEVGTHTKQQLYDLRDQAVERVLSQITDEVKEAAEYQIKDLKAYVEDLVSQEVLNLRITESASK